MNAQEAIKRVDKMLSSYAVSINSHRLFGAYQESIEEALEIYEAFKIVNESAKQFHAYHVPKIIKDAKELLAYGTDYREMNELRGVPIKDLGIEIKGVE